MERLSELYVFCDYDSPNQGVLSTLCGFMRIVQSVYEFIKWKCFFTKREHLEKVFLQLKRGKMHAS